MRLLRGLLLLYLLAPGASIAAAPGQPISLMPVEAQLRSAQQAVRIAQGQATDTQRELTAVRVDARRRTTAFLSVIVGATLVCGGLLLALLSLTRSRNAARAANRRLDAANIALERSLKVKSDFLATTSHEIRTPLNGILGMAQVMLADRALDRRMRERMELMHGAGETMRALVDDILDIAKIETGNLSVASEPLALRSLIEDTGRFWRTQADAKGVELRVELGECPPRIAGDEARLRQILFNLMSNALKFTAHGSVELSVATLSSGRGERLLLRVSDTGIGIPPDQQHLVFEKFHQVADGGMRQPGGSGLGLAICQSLAHAMGGEIALASAPDAGSIFTVDLPLLRVATSVPELVSGASADTGARGLAQAAILLVEPNALTQRVMGKGLRDEVGSVEAVADPNAAVARLARGGVDHVLIQFDTMVTDGRPSAEVLFALVCAATRAGARSIVMATPGGGADREALHALGVDVVLNRPAGTKLVLSALAALHGDNDALAIARGDNRLFTLAS